jgi:hypothetical protein
MALAILGLALALALALPTSLQSGSTIEKPGAEHDRPPLDTPSSSAPASPTKGPDPATLARAFVHPVATTATPEPPAPPPAAPEPQRAAWLQYLGSADKDGNKVYYFKDTRSNRVIALREGERKSQWELAARTKDGFVLRVESSSYLVPSAP